jgi:23S rRNA pseudouridine955/2504/2580 synthase/23S rRNA pseudouridine1911/1915/1917 synthase
MSKHISRPETIFENGNFIVINKPAHLLSIPDRTQSQLSLKDILINRYGEIFTVHRLDKETSGVIVFAKNEETHKQLSELFEGRDVEKYYVGLVHGKIQDEEGSIDAPIMEHPSKKEKMITNAKGKPSLTDYKVIENFRLFSWLKFRIHTGRTHQIRVHMQHIGHSIVCDELYGNDDLVYISSLKRNYHLSKNEEAEKPILSRLALHSSQLIFYLNDQHYSFEAELPKDLKATLQQLRKWNAD